MDRHSLEAPGSRRLQLTSLPVSQLNVELRRHLNRASPGSCKRRHTNMAPDAAGHCFESRRGWVLFEVPRTQSAKCRP